MLEDAVIGVQIKTAITLQCLSFIAIMYVDDTDIMLTTVNENDSLDDVYARALLAVEVWQEAIRISGGALRPNKCYWTAVDFRWKNGEWYYMNINDFQREVWVNDTDGIPRLVERKDVNDSKDGLGLHIQPDGSTGLQLEYAINKVKNYTSKLRYSSISKHHAMISASTSIFRSIIYMLPGSSFTEKDCRTIEKELYTTLLPKLGVNSKMPLPYRYGTHMFQGLNMLHVHSQMMIEQLKLFLTNAHNDTQIGIMYRATLESMQLEVGSIHDVFSLPYPSYCILATQSWLKVLWYCLHKYGITVKKQKKPFPLQRENDVSLMDELVNSKLFSHRDLREINNCRLYLQVFYLSDIVSGDGTKIMHHFANGYRTPARNSIWKWTRQSRPNESSWNLWKMAITNVWKKDSWTFLPTMSG